MRLRQINFVNNIWHNKLTNNRFIKSLKKKSIFQCSSKKNNFSMWKLKNLQEIHCSFCFWILSRQFSLVKIFLLSCCKDWNCQRKQIINWRLNIFLVLIKFSGIVLHPHIKLYLLASTKLSCSTYFFWGDLANIF